VADGGSWVDDKQKHEIISYVKENPKLTQQQIADNLTIKWDLFILMSLYKCKMYLWLLEEMVHLIYGNSKSCYDMCQDIKCSSMD
jgi:hypothetical protein